MLDSPLSFWTAPFTQAAEWFRYSPATNWQHAFSPSFNFNYNPEDEPIEAHVLSKVGSYGSQLSTLIDVIDILTAGLDRTGLSKEQVKALAEFDKLRERSGEAVDEARGLKTPQSIADAVGALAKRHPDRLPELREKLAEVLALTKDG